MGQHRFTSRLAAECSDANSAGDGEYTAASPPAAAALFRSWTVVETLHLGGVG